MRAAPSLILLALPCSVLAAPSFDCAKAGGQVEQLICQDKTLAALDNELAALYPKALANFSAEEKQREKTLQRGWIKGRNECWKESDLRQCVEQSYQTRITELQIRGGTVMVPSSVEYNCGDKAGLSVYFYNNTRQSAAMINLYEQAQPPIQTLAYEVRAASGAKYEGQNLSLWTKGSDATLERFGQPPLQCTEMKVDKE